MLELYQIQSSCVVSFSPHTPNTSTQSLRLVYWDSLRSSAFVKATSTTCVEDSFTLFTLTHPEGILSDNLLSVVLQSL